MSFGAFAIFRSTLGAAVTCAVLLSGPGGASASEGVSWDRVKNITESAQRLAQREKSQGAAETYRFIANCYATELLAESFNQGLESCIVEDYIHSRVTADVYSRIDEATRKRAGAPSGEALLGAMTQRLASAFAHYNVSETEARRLVDLIVKHGVPAFTKARFDKATATPR